MQHLFVYGSLLFPEIVKGLTGRTFRSIPAILPGYKRYSVEGADYPAIVKKNDARVEGKLLFDVDSKSLEIITFYEGDDYLKIPVEVNINEEKTAAHTFLWKFGLEYLSGRNWSKERFGKESLDFYLNEIIPQTKRAFE